jgi:hypothetical protein
MNGQTRAKSPFEKDVVVGLRGAAQGYRPGSGVHSRPKPIKWSPNFRALVRKSVVRRLSKRAVSDGDDRQDTTVAQLPGGRAVLIQAPLEEVLGWFR